jgi:hypothetical protein
VKYLIMIYSNPSVRNLWEEFSDAERVEFGRAHMMLTEELAASGELVASEGLPDPSQSTRVSVRDGRTIASDGPFPEVKEHLAGFYLVDCDSRQRALDIAAQVPDAAYTGVEVRPVLDLSGLDL